MNALFLDEVFDLHDTLSSGKDDTGNNFPPLPIEYWRIPGYQSPIDPICRRDFDAGQRWTAPRDPLVLDLDGDGIELTNSSSSVLFDHNADGIRAGSQWVKADDGLLVRDLNGNGQIDSGRELFGDQTQIGTATSPYSGPGSPLLARNGFEALRLLDSNRDKLISSADAAFAELKVWQDANQDGVSQVSELQTLTERGISQIKLGQLTQSTPVPGNGMPIITITDTRGESTGQSTFTKTRTDAAGNPIASEQTVRNVNFTQDPFYRKFTDDPAITDEAKQLAQVWGSGMVRDLQQAMSLKGADGQLKASSQALVNKVSTFMGSSGAVQRQAQINSILSAWGETSSFRPAMERNPWLRDATYLPSTLSYGSRGAAIALFATERPEDYRMLTVLEQFGGQDLIERFVATGQGSYLVSIDKSNPNNWRYYYDSYVTHWVDMRPMRMTIVREVYESLAQDIYKALYFETAGNDYLQDATTHLTEHGLRTEFHGLDARLQTLAALDKGAATVELAEFLRFANDFVVDTGWDGAAQLSDLLAEATFTPEQRAALARVQVGFAPANTGNMFAGNGNDILVGKAGDWRLDGNGGDDIIMGGNGNDVLTGGTGDDQLVGGLGNDAMYGDWGNDTYFWGAGQGNDAILDRNASVGGANLVVLRGLNPKDVRTQLIRTDDTRNIMFTNVHTGETLAVHTAFDYDLYWGRRGGPMIFQFADGTRGDMNDAVRWSVAQATDGDDVLVGTQLDDLSAKLSGGAGDDFIIGRGGADVMEGGAGNDVLWGNGSPTSALELQRGVPSVRGYTARASIGDNDVYVFGRGDGQDVILDVDTAVGNLDTLRFKAGIVAEDLALAQRGLDLIVSVQGTTDQITITGFYARVPQWYAAQTRPNAIERFEFADGTTWDLQQIAEAGWQGTAGDDNFTGDELANRMMGATGADRISGLEGDDTIAGGQGDDVLSGDAGNDSLAGGDGKDTLSGGSGDDILQGGAGNDLLYAGAGRDTIVFGRGDGDDVLASDSDLNVEWQRRLSGQPWVATGNNVVQLADGVTAADVRIRLGAGTPNTFGVAQSDLVLQLVNAQGLVTDSLTVRNAMRSVSGAEVLPADQFSLQEIRFADGTVWLPEQMMAQSLLGDAAGQTMQGFGGDDVFDGRGGNDTLLGGAGSNTYLFGRGDGHDVIKHDGQYGISTLVFKQGVAPQEVQVRRVGSAAVFTLLGSQDSITLESVFPGYSDVDGINRLAQVRFADGTIWDSQAVNELAVQATSGDDALADTLRDVTTVLAGGAGNDVLRSDYGGTTYVFNRGDGQDTIIENDYGGALDTLRFGAGIAAADLEVQTQPDGGVLISIRGTPDSVRLTRNSGYDIEVFEVGGCDAELHPDSELRSRASSGNAAGHQWR